MSKNKDPYAEINMAYQEGYDAAIKDARTGLQSELEAAYEEGLEEGKKIGAATQKNDSKVNHPSHYNQGIEAIEIIESHKLNFNLGNVIKYVIRAKHKGDELGDLEKAKWYLDRETERARKDNTEK